MLAGMKWLHRFSFRQLLLLAFLLMAVLLGVTATEGLRTLAHLVTQNRDSLADSIEVNADSRLLMAHVVTMERSARQFLVLAEPALHQRYLQAAEEGAAAARRISGTASDPELLSRWLAERAAIDDVLDGTSGHHAEARLAQGFRKLGAISESAAARAQAHLEAENQRFLDALESRRQKLARQVLMVIALGLAMALSLGLWLGRPFKRLSQAIAGLGGNTLDRPIEISGPADIQLLGRQLDWLRLRLVELDEDKSRFLRHVSHELKTPLSALREGVSLLEDGVPGPLSADQREVVRILRHHTGRLQTRIEELLHFNTLAFEARELKPCRLDLAELIRQQVTEQTLQWQGKRLRIDARVAPVWVEADPGKLAMIIANLLSNAIRFSPPEGLIRIALACAGERAMLDIVDQGPGIAEADRKRIFEPFYRGQRQPDAALGGSGIGLSIVREYIHAHGGSITLLPDNPGAHFHVELPHACQH